MESFPDATLRIYEPGQVVVYYGDAPNYMMFIKSGAVKFYDTDSRGNEKILHIKGKGSLFSLSSSFEDKKQVDAFYTTLCRSELIMIPIEEFRHLLKTTPNYAYQILGWYAEEMSHIILQLNNLGKSTAKQKVLGALDYLIDQHSTANHESRNWHQVDFPVSQQLLADMTGITRETANAILRDASKLNIVQTPRKQILEIHKINLKKQLNEIS